MAKLLLLAAVALAAFFVIAFQLELLPFAANAVVADHPIWPIIYQSYRVMVIGVALIVLASNRQVLRQIFPVLIICSTLSAMALVHPLDSISRNFISAMIFVVCVAVLASASAPITLLRFTAAATGLNAVICLLDILFSDGFTNTAGRAAGLSINPNAAAAALLLGAASSFWAVPQRFRSSFLLLVGAGIFVTLSKSTILTAMVICVCVGLDLIWNRARSLDSRPRVRLLRPILLTIGLAGWTAAAVFSNDQFSSAITLSLRGIGGALPAFHAAHRSISNAVQSDASPQLNEPRAEKKSNSDDLTKETKKDDHGEDLIREIGRRAKDEGDINSISARELFLERAFLTYQSGPFFGRGLAAAYALEPHNTFLLFAAAFGPLGWLMPIGFLGLTLYWVRSVRQMPLFLATLAVMVTSHDVLLAPGLLSPIVFGVVGFNALRYRTDDNLCASPAIGYVAVAAPVLFALGGVSIAGIGNPGTLSVPKLLLFLGFGVVLLWSGAIWLSSKKLRLQNQCAS